jgi:ABC-type Zn uptake system ZnuABC Zn-binding protein ZnuA
MIGRVNMKKLITIILIIFLLCGCTPSSEFNIVATTLPVYTFTERLCEGTDITVGQLVTENISCIHDYTLKVGQMRMLEHADAVVINGAGLEAFLEDALHATNKIIDASKELTLLSGDHHNHDHHDGHSHEEDPHIWLSTTNAAVMATNICNRLCDLYPAHAQTIRSNLENLHYDLNALQQYGEDALKDLSSRELITFHDGFSYLAENFNLTILEAVEEESGSEASAKQLISLINLVREHNLPAIFTEVNGSVSAASIISAETGIPIYSLDMGISGEDYFEMMYRNIDTLREALN